MIILIFLFLLTRKSMNPPLALLDLLELETEDATGRGCSREKMQQVECAADDRGCSIYQLERVTDASLNIHIPGIF